MANVRNEKEMKKLIVVAVITLAVVCGVALMRAAAVPGVNTKTSVKPSIKGVAEVNRETVTVEEFQEYVDGVAVRLHFAAGTTKVFESHELEELLEGYLKERILLYQDARATGAYETEEFQRSFEMAHNNLVARKFTNGKLRELIEVTDDDLADIVPSEWIHLKMRQILLLNPREAEGVLALIRDGGDFIELLREHSVGPGARRDGDLGYKFPGSGYFSPADDMYLFTLEKGDISDVVETPLGPAIVKIEDKKVFSKEEIEEMLQGPRNRIFNEKLQKHISEIRKSAGVEIYVDALYDCVRAMEDGRKKDAVIAKAGDREFYFFDLQRTIMTPYDRIYIDPDQDKLFELYRGNVDQRITDFLLAQEGTIWGVKAESDREKKDLKKYDQLVAMRIKAESILSDLDVTDEEAREYFSENPNEFNRPERVRLWQIFVTNEETARLVYDKLLEGGSLSGLALEYSEDEVSKDLGGVVGTFTREDMLPEIAEAAFALLPGDFSEIIKTDLGYHIVWVDSTSSAKTYEFDEIRGKARKAVLRGKQEKRFSEYVDALYEKAVIEVNDDALRKMAENSKTKKSRARPGSSPHNFGQSPHGPDGMPTSSSGPSPHGPGGMLPHSSAPSPHGPGGMLPHGSAPSPHGSGEMQSNGADASTQDVD
jgi:parvulin-like peptidyl-prolyl isomerase